MKLPSLGLTALFVSILATQAAPSPDRLLSSDTWAVFTIPDFQQAKTKISDWPMAQLWSDPAMKPFRDKFMTRLNSEGIEGIEKDMGIKVGDLLSLAQGQITIAVTPGNFDGKEGVPGFVLIVDSKDKTEALQTQLAQLKKKWIERGNKVRTEKIRDVEFSAVMMKPESDEKEKADPDEPAVKPATEKEARPEILIGQSESLLLVGNTVKDIEKILVRQSGGSVPSLSEEATFATSYGSTLRDSFAYGWINLRSLVALGTKMAAAASAGGEPGGDFMGMKPDKILAALGLQGLESASFGIKDTPDGPFTEGMLSIPASKRRGLFKLLAIEPLEATPPAFVPADALQFRRVRVDMPKLWANVEGLVNEVAPQMAGVFKMLVDNAGKDKDPNFDLRKSVIANLGNDIITYNKAPRGATLEDLQGGPQLSLIGSPNPEQLAAALKAIGSFLPVQGGGPPPKEREFLGRKVYSLSLPQATVNGKRIDRSLHYAASGSYVAIAMDEATLEEFLRSSATPGKSLRDLPGLVAAAEKVGGMNTGFFVYQNYKESTRHMFDVMKKQGEAPGGLFSNTPLADKVSDDDFKKWIDVSLLPDFDKIAKYFFFSVSAFSVNNDGLRLRGFAPNPPQAGK